MKENEYRARIRQLMESGELPTEHPATRRRRASGSAQPLVFAGGGERAPCLVCGQRAPAITYACPDGRRVQVHRAPCDELWRSESARRSSQLAGAAVPANPSSVELPRSEFIQWLHDRLEGDAAFQSRMSAALLQMRVERAVSAMRKSPARDGGARLRPAR